MDNTPLFDNKTKTEGNVTTRKQYDLNFKKRVVAKGKEMGSMTAVARQHELVPNMVFRWARELKRADLDQLRGNTL
ncbi:transposase [Salipaludibacillus agaradhaerens]|nr:transposase [Salipaludibacillus agaradhaerens]